MNKVLEFLFYWQRPVIGSILPTSFGGYKVLDNHQVARVVNQTRYNTVNPGDVEINLRETYD